MSTKQELEATVALARSQLVKAVADLATFDQLAENNVYGTLQEAINDIEDMLLNRAHDDCEGSYSCGADKYAQEFYVEATLYVGTLTCAYNRHDKTYYYVDGHDFTYEQKP